jgi:hypothetical protein
VAVEVPATVPGSTIHFHIAVPVESATCFLLRPAAAELAPEWYFTLAWQVAPGAVTAMRVASELAATEAVKAVISTVRLPGLGVGPDTGLEVGPAGVAVVAADVEAEPQVAAEFGDAPGIFPPVEVATDVPGVVATVEPEPAVVPAAEPAPADPVSPAATGMAAADPPPGLPPGRFDQ